MKKLHFFVILFAVSSCLYVKAQGQIITTFLEKGKIEESLNDDNTLICDSIYNHSKEAGTASAVGFRYLPQESKVIGYGYDLNAPGSGYDNTSPIPSVDYEYIYNNYGYVTSMVFSAFNNPYSRVRYIYNDGKQLTTEISEYWENEWKESNKSDYAYDNGKLKTVTSGNGSKLREYTYDNNANLISIIYKELVSSQWVATSKTESRYNDEGQLVADSTSTYVSNSWVYGTKNLYQYNNKGQEILKTNWRYDTNSISWLQEGKYETSYAETNKSLIVTGVYSKLTDSQWSEYYVDEVYYSKRVATDNSISSEFEVLGKVYVSEGNLIVDCQDFLNAMIYDISGKQIAYTDKAVTNVSNLNAGVYIITVTLSDGKTFTTKVIK